MRGQDNPQGKAQMVVGEGCLGSGGSCIDGDRPTGRVFKIWDRDQLVNGGALERLQVGIIETLDDLGIRLQVGNCCHQVGG